MAQLTYPKVSPVVLTLESPAEVEAVLLMLRPTVTELGSDNGPLYGHHGTGLRLTQSGADRKGAAHEVYAQLHALVEQTNGRKPREV